MYHSIENAIDALALECHEAACKAGFWDQERNDGEAIALIHAELSELLEGLRRGNPPSDHIAEFKASEEECADVIIRLLDFAAGRGWRIGAVIRAKLEYNASRPRKHGKEF